MLFKDSTLVSGGFLLFIYYLIFKTLFLNDFGLIDLVPTFEASVYMKHLFSVLTWSPVDAVTCCCSFHFVCGQTGHSGAVLRRRRSGARAAAQDGCEMCVGGRYQQFV